MIKHLLSPAIVALCAILVVGCESTRSERKPKQREGGYRPAPPVSDEPSTDAPSDESSAQKKRREKPEELPPSNTSNNPPLTSEPPVKTGDLPYAKGVAGKPGFVTSPYAPAAGYIDVRGFPPGTEVKDPYSGKTFLVP